MCPMNRRTAVSRSVHLTAVSQQKQDGIVDIWEHTDTKNIHLHFWHSPHYSQLIYKLPVLKVKVFRLAESITLKLK